MKIKTKSVHRVEYGDLEDFIREVYGIDYEMASDAECSNDTSHEYNGITAANAADLNNPNSPDSHRIQDWKSSQGRKQMWGPRLILLDLVRQGKIPEGDYVIRVSW